MSENTPRSDYWDTVNAGLCGYDEDLPGWCPNKATHNVHVTGERDDGQPTCPKHLSDTVLFVLEFDYPDGKAKSVTVSRIGDDS